MNKEINNEIKQTRKQELKNMTFRGLQHTEEYKYFCGKYLNVILMNKEVEYILKKSTEDINAPFSYDDFDLFYYDTEEYKTDLKEEIQELDNTTASQKKELQEELKELEDIEEIKDFCIDNYLNSNIEDYERPTEVLQWFLICDDRLLHQLEQKGEVILNNTFWGRQGCGQNINMDYVIIDIFKSWFLELYGLDFDLNQEVK